VIVLDSAPLGLLVHTKAARSVTDCRNWIAGHLSAGTRIVVPEIVDYEIRRELLRANLTPAISALDAFNAAEPGRLLALNSADLRLAADLWARARNQGIPTADRFALDIDVILSAQALGLGLPPSDFVVATGNVRHLSRFVPAEEWQNI
jgi:predicted nucleic acid-binding protein